MFKQQNEYLFNGIDINQDLRSNMHIGIEIKKAYSDFQGLKLYLMFSFIFASVIFVRISKTFHVCVSIDFTNMLRDFG